MTTVLGCIADDFTGATDLAGLLARSGVRVSLRIGVPTGPVTDPAPFEVIALKIRMAPVAEATSQALAALDWLKQTGAERFFWKYCSTFDSTAEGNIGPVAEALMEALGATHTIYCPAFPENGRSIFMGNLFVGQQPLAESPMRNHPLTPMRDSNLMRLLAPQVKRMVGLIDRLTVAKGPEAIAAALIEEGRDDHDHIVVDAVENEDLTRIATACRNMPLITGGSALAMPLPALYQADGLLAADAARMTVPTLPGQRIVLSGSCSSMTNLQVAAYLKVGRPAYRLDPLAIAEQGAQPALDWLAAQDLTQAPMIYATADPDSVRAVQDKLGVAAAGELIEQTLARCAVAARNMGARQIVVAGGETSGAVTQALGVVQMDIGPEIAPGVPWCFARLDGAQIAITLKSGNFGAPSFFTDAFGKLEAK